jgi:hypothetical protein
VSGVPDRIAVNDEVIYQYKRWQVVDTISVEQSPDYQVPRKPGKLRLLRGHEAVTVTVDQVVQATPGKRRP